MGLPSGTEFYVFISLWFLPSASVPCHLVLWRSVCNFGGHGGGPLSSLEASSPPGDQRAPPTSLFFILALNAAVSSVQLLFLSLSLCSLLDPSCIWL